MIKQTDQRQPKLAPELLRSVPLLVLLVTTAMFCNSRQGFAQSLTGDNDTLRAMMASPSESAGSVQDRLDALIMSTKRARQERQSDDQPPAIQAAEKARETSFDSMRQGTAETTNAEMAPHQPTDNSSRSMSEIRERIRILQRLRRDRFSSSEAQLQSAIPGGVKTPALSTPGGDVIQTSPEKAGKPETVSPEPTLSSIDASLASPTEVASAAEIAAPDTVLSAERILPKPVNAMLLGESLYRTRNFESALKAFRSVDSNVLSQSDRTWLDLLTALCQRKLGDYDKAQGTLRDIANEESSDYPVMAAKWWLKHAEASHGTQTKLNSLSADFDMLVERSKKYVPK